MKQKTFAVVFLCVSLVLVVAAAVLAAGSLGGSGQAEAPAEPQDTPAPEEAGGGTAASGKKGPVVSKQAEAMGPEYFADAGFLGNAVTSGLWLYNNDDLLPADATGHWFCADNLTILGAAPYAAQMAGYDFGKIYIGFGINEVNYNKNTVRAAYDTVIDQLQADHPDAIIYLMSVTPVSKYCDENLGTRRSGVQAFNDMLQDIARQQQVWYLDVYPVLCGEDGYLPSEVTPDGIHFSPAHYQLWFDYMRTHYVPDGHSQPVPATAAPDEGEDGEDAAG